MVSAYVDAPERKQPFGNRSRQNLSSYVAGKDVLIDYSKRDRYKRILGKVLISDEDINLKQVEDGMAWHYKRYQREQTAIDRELYSDAEIAARKAKRGLWKDSNPIPPWKWRKGTR